jgi:hypothetical protein
MSGHGQDYFPLPPYRCIQPIFRGQQISARDGDRTHRLYITQSYQSARAPHPRLTFGSYLDPLLVTLDHYATHGLFRLLVRSNQQYSKLERDRLKDSPRGEVSLHQTEAPAIVEVNKDRTFRYKRSIPGVVKG